MLPPGRRRNAPHEVGTFRILQRRVSLEWLLGHSLQQLGKDNKDNATNTKKRLFTKTLGPITQGT